MMRKPVDIVNRKDMPADEAVLELVHAVMHQFRSQQYRALEGGTHDITHMESKVLGYIGHHPGATQSDLARHSGRDKAQLARLIKGLRERAFLVGEEDATDRRNVRLSVTAEGSAVLHALQQQSEHLATLAVAGLSVAERQQLMAQNVKPLQTVASLKGRVA